MSRCAPCVMARYQKYIDRAARYATEIETVQKIPIYNSEVHIAVTNLITTLIKSRMNELSRAQALREKDKLLDQELLLAENAPAVT